MTAGTTDAPSPTHLPLSAYQVNAPTPHPGGARPADRGWKPDSGNPLDLIISRLREMTAAEWKNQGGGGVNCPPPQKKEQKKAGL